LRKTNYKIISVPISRTSNIFHFFFWKIHSGISQKQPEFPSNKTIFVTNLPIQPLESVKECLISVFRILFGPISSISCESTHAHIIFEEDCLEKASQLDVYITLDVEDKIQDENVGLKKWLLNYNETRPDHSALQRRIDYFMEEYDEKMREEEHEKEKSAGLPDEDGFVLVQRVRNKARISDGTTTVAVANAKSAEELKPKSYEKVDFYRFQVRSARKSQLETLKKQFEDDKKKIAKMKQSRKFKPY